ALALAIAFTNLADLLIVRSIDRRRELAVRSALGAQPLEIARQLLLEAEALVSIGIAGGVLLALWTTPVVGRLALAQFGDLAGQDVAVNWRVMAAASIVGLTSGWICAWLPAAVDELPLTGDRGRRVVAARPNDAGREAVVRAASAGYFDVMRIPIVAGRSFDSGDNAAAPPRVVVSRSLAERLFASDDPVGRRVW